MITLPWQRTFALSLTEKSLMPDGHTGNYGVKVAADVFKPGPVDPALQTKTKICPVPPKPAPGSPGHEEAPAPKGHDQQ